MRKEKSMGDLTMVYGYDLQGFMAQGNEILDSALLPFGYTMDNGVKVTCEAVTMWATKYSRRYYEVYVDNSRIGRIGMMGNGLLWEVYLLTPDSDDEWGISLDYGDSAWDSCNRIVQARQTLQ
jgi:hypothetical protein